MNLKTRIATVAAASIFALSMGTAAFAAESTVSQEITQGVFSASIAEGTLTEVQYSHSDRDNSGSLTLSVNDLRGTYAGWNVTVKSSAFYYDGTAKAATGDHDIAASNFTLGTTEAPVHVSGQVVDSSITGATNGTLDSDRTPITAEVGSGSGSYTQSLPVILTVPSDSPVGIYTATLTVTSSAFPTGD